MTEKKSTAGATAGPALQLNAALGAGLDTSLKTALDAEPVSTSGAAQTAVPLSSSVPVAMTAGALRYRFADAELDDAEGVLRVQGLPVAVEPRPLRLLKALLQQPGVVLSKDELFEQVWNGRATVDHVLANAVSKLRAALGAQAGACIVTVPRVGYRFDGSVLRVRVATSAPALVAGCLLPGRDSFVLQRRLGSARGVQAWLARHHKLDHQRVFLVAQDNHTLKALKQQAAQASVLHHNLGLRDDLVQVLDTQFAAPPFYLECSLGGTDLRLWAPSQQGWDGWTRQARLDLFLQIARAVEAAHGVGVLHGALRPSQLLVQGGPKLWQVRVTGFGAWGAHDHSVTSEANVTDANAHGLESLSHGAQGSAWPHTAPELLQGHPATAQCDVYALGVLLFQMAVGNLSQSWVTGWQRQIDDPLLCELIVAATEGQTSLRLHSVAELVDRLGRLEQRRQTQMHAAARRLAAEQTAAELLRLKARRPWLLGAVGSLASGMVASVLFGLQTRSALEQATQHSARAAAVNDFLQEDFLTGIEVTAVGNDATVSMKALLERASARASDRFAGQPGQEALVRGQLAGVFHVLSMFQRAENEYRQALALADQAGLQADPKILKLRFDLVRNLSVHDKLPEARQRLLQAQADAGELIHQDTALAQAAAAAQMNVLMSSEQFAQAEQVGQRLVALADQGLNKGRPHEWFAARVMLGDTLYRLGRLPEAQALLSALLTSERRRALVGDVTWARAQVCLARVQNALGQTAAAEAALVAARDSLIQRIGPDEHYVQIANAKLASIFDLRGDFARAQAAYQHVHDSYARAVGAQHPSTRVMALNLAISQLNLGRPAVALTALNEGRAWFVQYAGGEQGAVVQAIDFERARALTGVGQAAQAHQVLSTLDAKVIAAAAPARDWPWRLQAETGRALAAAGQRQAGLAMIQAALPGLQDEGAAPWVLRQYRALAEAAGSTNKDIPL